MQANNSLEADGYPALPDSLAVILATKVASEFCAYRAAPSSLACMLSRMASNLAKLSCRHYCRSKTMANGHCPLA
jgi:hypothetical protein